jgi:hypothetical protein
MVLPFILSFLFPLSSLPKPDTKSIGLFTFPGGKPVGLPHGRRARFPGLTHKPGGGKQFYLIFPRKLTKTGKNLVFIFIHGDFP